MLRLYKPPRRQHELGYAAVKKPVLRKANQCPDNQANEHQSDVTGCEVWVKVLACEQDADSCEKDVSVTIYDRLTDDIYMAKWTEDEEPSNLNEMLFQSFNRRQPGPLAWLQALVP